MPPQILLLTSTIVPPANAPNLARVDVEMRRADYARALESHLDLLEQGTVDRLVFADNSDSDVSSLEAAAVRRGLRERAEFISYAGLDYPPVFGRAYGESRILEYAMDHSRLIQCATDPQTLIWKVTGRYWVRNLRAIIESRPASVDLYCNMRNFPHRWVDMYLLAWTRHGYEVFLRDVADAIRLGRPETPPSVSPEELLRNWLDQRRTRAVLVPRFHQTPILDGIRGYDNRSYAQANRWKNVLRRVALRLAPGVWI